MQRCSAPFEDEGGQFLHFCVNLSHHFYNRPFKMVGRRDLLTLLCSLPFQGLLGLIDLSSELNLEGGNNRQCLPVPNRETRKVKPGQIPLRPYGMSKIGPRARGAFRSSFFTEHKDHPT
jgi:hypothetical protein